MTNAAEFILAAIVAPHPASAAAARDILVEGGNAIEAAVAAAVGASLVLPHRNGLGGDGMWLIREAGGRVRTLDARGPIAAAATGGHGGREPEERPVEGPDSVATVPGAVGGWQGALDLSAALGGKIPSERLLEAALGQEQRRAPSFQSAGAEEARQALAGPGDGQVAPGPGGMPGRAEGDHAGRSALFDTLRHLAHAGLDDFYRGDIVRELAADLEHLGSPLGRDDLRRYEAQWRTPASLRVGDAALEAPPTGQGASLLLTMALCARLRSRRADTFEHVHGLMQARARAEATVRQMVEDGGTLADILSASVIERDVQQIQPRGEAPPLAAPDEAAIWIGAVDASGLAVSLVQSSGLGMRSGVILPRTGVPMGNRSALFSRDRAAGTGLRPGDRAPLRSVPAIAALDDGRVIAWGAAGGTGASAVAGQVFAAWRSGAELAEAVESARIVPGGGPGRAEAALEAEGGFDPSITAALERVGHQIGSASDRTPFGEAGAVLRRPSGRIEAVADTRTEALAAGL